MTLDDKIISLGKSLTKGLFMVGLPLVSYLMPIENTAYARNPEKPAATKVHQKKVYQCPIPANYSSDEGRFTRTRRWDKLTQRAEKKYKLEKGILVGLMMQESYGNPLQLNDGNDGGAGLMMFQPGTARAYGLKVWGDSKVAGRDTKHGKELIQLVKRYHSNLKKLSRRDERFSPEKSIDAGAHYLSDLHKRYKTWDNALSAYNRGSPAEVPEETFHVKRTRGYQDYYLAHRYDKCSYSHSGKALAKKGKQKGKRDKFVPVGKNSQGKLVFRYEINPRENQSIIAKYFNQWDRHQGDKLEEVKYIHVVDVNGKYSASLHPGKRAYVLADTK